jgi:hypothetical protein
MHFCFTAVALRCPPVPRQFAGNVLVYGAMHPSDGDVYGGLNPDNAEAFFNALVEMEVCWGWLLKRVVTHW